MLKDIRQDMITFARLNPHLDFLFTPWKIYKYAFAEKFYKLSNDFPTSLLIEPTNACNLKCVFCPRNKSSRKIGFISFELFKKIINDCHGRRLYRLWLHKDGEPLLHPQIAKLYKYAKNNCDVQDLRLTTNGILLKGKVACDLLKVGLDHVTISLDSLKRETYKKVKGVDAYDIVEENARNFIEMRNDMGLDKPNIELKTILMTETWAEVLNFRRKWRGVADSTPVRIMNTWAGGVDSESSYKLKHPKEPHPCFFLWNNLVIGWSGKASVCCVDWNEEMVVGNVKDQSIYEIYNSERMDRMRLEHLIGKFKLLPKCKNCDIRPLSPKLNPRLKKKLLNEVRESGVVDK